MAKAAETLSEESDGVTVAEIEDALEAEGATQVNVRPFVADTGTVSRKARRALPGDLFSVSSTWADWFENGQKHVAFYGRWNYRDDVVGSGAPHDAAGAVVSGFGQTCWRNVSTGLTTQSSDGTHTGLSYLKSSGHQKSVFGVEDRTSGFRLLTDMGFAWIDMKRVASGCTGTKSGRFFHEHNQGGGGGWSASLTIAFFSVSYNGSAGDKLQKAAPISYY